MDTIFEVHSTNKSGKPIVSAHYDHDEAIVAAIKISKSNGKASLITVEQDEDEVETEKAQTIYVKGESQGEGTLNKVRNKMDEVNTGVNKLSGNAAVVDEAYKASKKAEKAAASAAKKAERDEARAAKKAEKDAARAAKKAITIAKGPRQKFDDEAIITVNMPENPKRANTKAHGWYEQYVDQMSVKDYRELLGKGQANACLDWDAKRSYITVSGGTPEAEPVKPELE